jgi:hypothetical protein
MLVTNINHYQQELIKIIPPNLSEEDLKAIKKMLVQYFAKKVTREMDDLWDEKGFKTAEDMENYLNE